MDELLKNASVRTPLQPDAVLWCFNSEYPISVRIVRELCESHERLRMELEAAMKVAKEINDMMAQVTSMGSVS